MSQPGAIAEPDSADDGTSWDVVVVCGMPFGQSPPFGDTHLARALARRHRVLVIDRPRPAQRLRRAPIVETVSDRLAVYRPFTTPRAGHERLHAVNERLYRAQINAVIRRHTGPNPVIVTFDPKRGTFDELDPAALVYWQRDLAADAHYNAERSTVIRHHEHLLRSADLTTGVSAELVEASRPLARRSHHVPNGADIDHFETPSPPPPTELGDNPVIGYLGALSWRVDVALLEDLAQKRPDWTFALIGAVSVEPPRAPNIRIFGERPYDELPRWSQKFDVGLIPYLDNDFNNASFPLKALDYLASGVPVVSTALPAMRGFADEVTVGTSSEEIEALIAEAIEHPPDPESCQAVARAHSWDQRSKTLEGLIQSAIDEA